MKVTTTARWLKHLLTKYTTDSRQIGAVFYLLSGRESKQLDLMLYILEHPRLSMPKILEKAAELSDKVDL